MDNGLDNGTLAEINRWLTLTYGLGYDDRPNFRLVWGPSQWENRWGHFEEWSEDGRLFLREFRGVKHLPKYAQHGRKHILEKLVVNYQPDILVGVKYSYEPIWVFDKKDKDGNIIHPWLAAIQFFMKVAIDGPRMAASRMIKEQGDSYDQEALMYSQELEHEAPNLAYGGVGVL